MSTAATGRHPTHAKTLSVFLVGNPNTGKTTLFNALTGLRHRVGNYPGVTVETKTGRCHHDGHRIEVTDVPGTYSLSPRSPDEMLVVDLLLGHRSELARPDVVVCVLDASNLDRNLYLATQVFELGVPVVLALNMVDIAEARGVRIDAQKLSRSLGVPVMLVQANIRRGLEELKSCIIQHAGAGAPAQRPIFPEPFRREVEDLAQWLGDRTGRQFETYLLERALIDAGGHTERWLQETCRPALAGRLEEARPALAGRLEEARTALARADCPVPAVEARTRYAWIAQRTRDSVGRPAQRRRTVTDRIDAVLLHRLWGLAAFLAVMAVVFQSLFRLADEFLMAPIEAGFGWLGGSVAALLPDGPVRGLVGDGVIAGVGNVLIFLPQIVILFGFIAILEDCGYMARAAFLMDKLMARSGLSGKSFIPMLSSFACAIPGVMATRVIEDRRDRLATILVAPLMSCSARLPVYVLLIGAFVPPTQLLGLVGVQGLVLLAMYSIGLIVAPVVALLLKRTLLRGDPPVFLLELPPYKVPSLSTVLYRMVDRGWAFARRAGTIILATTVVIWALQYYPHPASVDAQFASRLAELEASKNLASAPLDRIEAQIADLEAERAATYQAQSILGRMGKAIEPAVRPLGWDWRIGMAAIASFPAREVVIAALGTIFSAGADVDLEETGSRMRLESALRSAAWPDGRPLFDLAVALSLMVFFALCCQCAATLAVIRRETNSWRWPIFTFAYMTGLAYAGALVTYQVASRLI